MNVERFAGDNPIFQKMALDLKANEALMRQRQAAALQQARSIPMRAHGLPY